MLADMLGGRRVLSGSACVAAALGFGSWGTSAEATHPSAAIALYLLAVVAAGCGIVLWFRPARQRTAVLDWREQEDRFRRLNPNVRGHYERVAGSRER